MIDFYALTDSKEGQVKVETRWFPQVKKDKAAAIDEKADAGPSGVSS